VIDMMQHQSFGGGHVLDSGYRHTAYDPAVKCVTGDDESEFELAHLCTFSFRQMRRRDDRRSWWRFRPVSGAFTSIFFHASLSVSPVYFMLCDLEAAATRRRNHEHVVHFHVHFSSWLELLGWPCCAQHVIAVDLRCLSSAAPYMGRCDGPIRWLQSSAV
jgi:hypothetical protein